LFTFIINSKNYEKASGQFSAKLAEAAASSSANSGLVHICLAVPAFSVQFLKNRFPQLSILAQHVDNAALGSTTGFLVPEIAKMSGAEGSLINHSEHRIPSKEIQDLVMTFRKLKLVSVVCAQDDAEVEKFASMGPDFVAVEPPDLIGSGNAVSKARPELISNSARALKRGSAGLGKKPLLLCGAGIVEPEDVRVAVKLGADGILVASGVIKANDWGSKIRDLSLAFSDGREK
jgi:triosephosphate isomerase (TIM)